MRCGRRDEIGAQGSFNFPAEDEWRDRDGHQVCSYCGSLSPDELFAAIEAGCELDPTDKNYKVYVDLPNPKVGQPCVIGSSSGPAFNPFGEPNQPDLTDAEKAAGRYQREIMGHESPNLNMKFYF